MKRLLLAVILWALGCSFASAQSTKLCFTSGNNCLPAVQAAVSIPISISTSTTTQLVALVASQRIYVTSWDIMAGGTGTFKLVYGTGTNCGTGQGDLTGAYPLIAQAGIAKGNGTGPVILVPLANALCAVTVGAVQYSGSLSHVEF